MVIWWHYNILYIYIYITLYDGGAITILKNDGLRQWAWVLHQPDGILGSRHREDLIVKSEKTHREKWGKLGEMMKISPGKIMVSRESDGTKLGISQKVFFGLKKSGIYPEKAVLSKNTYDWPVDLGEKGWKGYGSSHWVPHGTPGTMGWFVVVYHSKDGPRWLVPWLLNGLTYPSTGTFTNYW